MKHPCAKVLYLPLTTWAELTTQVQNHLINLAHGHTGQARPSRVRLDVPPVLASAPAAQYRALLSWLEAHQLQPQILGSRRDDIRLEVQ